MTRRVLAICLLTCLAVVSALGQDYKALIGKWNMTSETDSDSVNWTLVLKESDGKLVGSLSSDQGEIPAKDFSYVDGVLKFKAPYEGQDYDIELKATPEKLVGTWSGGGASGKTTGTKA
jgi:hypothetical protein